MVDKYLIVNADDFGLSPGVSEGIIRAHRDGILTSTTFMVNFPWSAECATMLKDAPDLGVGIHLNITTGRPVLPPDQVPSLVVHHGTMAKDYLHLRFRVKPEELHREWEAQVALGTKLLGRLPTHLDTHGFTQGYVEFARVMVAVALKYGVPAVRILRPGADVPKPSTYRRWSPLDLVYNRYLAKSSRILEASVLKHPDRTLLGDLNLSRLLQRLDRVLPGVTEMVTHPGYIDDTLIANSSLREQRTTELEALTDPEVRRQVEKKGIQLVSFAHLQG